MSLNILHSFNFQHLLNTSETTFLGNYWSVFILLLNKSILKKFFFYKIETKCYKKEFLGLLVSISWSLIWLKLENRSSVTRTVSLLMLVILSDADHTSFLFKSLSSSQQYFRLTENAIIINSGEEDVSVRYVNVVCVSSYLNTHHLGSSAWTTRRYRQSSLYLRTMKTRLRCVSLMYSSVKARVFVCCVPVLLL